MARRRDPLLAQALLQAGVRYDPQVQALLEQRHQRAQEYTSERRSNKATEAAVRRSVDESIPGVRDAFSQALATVQAQAAGVAGQGGSVEGGQVPAFERRIGESLANALTELTQERQGATAGRAYANQQARQSYLSDQGTISRSLRDVLGQKGDYATATLGSLKESQRGRAVTTRGQDLSHQDRVASINERRDAARNRAKPKPTSGLGSLKPEQESKVIANINEAVTWLGRGTPADVLSTGASVPHTQGGKTITIKVPKISDPLVLQAAQEINDNGSLKPKTMQALHRRGIHVPGEWRPPTPRQSRRQVKQATQTIQHTLPFG